MKKFLVVLCGVIVATQAIGMLSPKQGEQIEKQYKENQSKCPTDRPLYSESDKKCYPCDTVKSIVFFSYYTQNNCQKICNNRKIYQKYVEDVRGGQIGFCVLKNTPGENFTFSAGLSWSGWIKDGVCPDAFPINFDGNCYKKCPDGSPLLDYYSENCVGCDYNFATLAVGCEKCANREIVGEFCLIKCPEDKPLLTFKGICKKCDESGFDELLSGCAKCQKEKNVKDKWCLYEDIAK